LNKEHFFLKVITYGPLIFIPFLIGAVFFVTIQIYKESFKENLRKTEENLYSIEKKSLENKIHTISDLINYKKSIIKKELMSRVRDRVKKAHLIATNIYKQNKNTKTKQEIQKIIIDALRPLIWNNAESFIWIVDYDGILNMGPEYLQKFEGKSIQNLQDSTGSYVIKEEIKIAKEKGEGFLWDSFTKPSDKSSKQYEQVAYIKNFGAYNWYFGSAEYLDTATKSSDKKLLNMIRKIDYIDSHYLFIITKSGDIILNRSVPALEGKNVFKIKNKKVKEVVEKISNSIKNKTSTSLIYNWENPKNHKIEEKYSFIQQLPNSEWIIGSGFYISFIEEKLSQAKVNAYEVFYKKAKDIFYITIILIIITLIISFYISKVLRRRFKKYKARIEIKSNELQELNETLENKVQIRTAELEVLKNNFEVLATTDALTNINNRYSIMKILETELKRSQRYKQPLSIILYDIDFFKKVNDIYGHDVGDSTLMALSDLVQSTLREIDFLGRYGGEEFLIILPNTEIKDALYFAQRLKEKIQSHNFKIIEKLTISAGLVEANPHENIDEIFKRVDNLLYTSKENGRNKISF